MEETTNIFSNINPYETEDAEDNTEDNGTEQTQEENTNNPFSGVNPLDTPSADTPTGDTSQLPSEPVEEEPPASRIARPEDKPSVFDKAIDNNKNIVQKFIIDPFYSLPSGLYKDIGGSIRNFTHVDQYDELMAEHGSLEEAVLAGDARASYHLFKGGGDPRDGWLYQLAESSYNFGESISPELEDYDAVGAFKEGDIVKGMHILINGLMQSTGSLVARGVLMKVGGQGLGDFQFFNSVSGRQMFELDKSKEHHDLDVTQMRQVATFHGMAEVLSARFFTTPLLKGLNKQLGAEGTRKFVEQNVSDIVRNTARNYWDGATEETIVNTIQEVTDYVYGLKADDYTLSQGIRSVANSHLAGGFMGIAGGGFSGAVQSGRFNLNKSTSLGLDPIETANQAYEGYVETAINRRNENPDLEPTDDFITAHRDPEAEALADFYNDGVMQQTHTEAHSLTVNKAVEAIGNTWNYSEEHVESLRPMIDTALHYARELNIDDYTAIAFMKIESDFRHIGNLEGRSSAFGAMQVTNTALAQLDESGISLENDVDSVEGRIEAGLKYFNDIRSRNNFDVDEAVGAYFAGEGIVSNQGLTNTTVEGQHSSQHYVNLYHEAYAEIAGLEYDSETDSVLGFNDNYTLPPLETQDLVGKVVVEEDGSSQETVEAEETIEAQATTFSPSEATVDNLRTAKGVGAVTAKNIADTINELVESGQVVTEEAILGAKGVGQATLNSLKEAGMVFGETEVEASGLLDSTDELAQELRNIEDNIGEEGFDFDAGRYGELTGLVDEIAVQMFRDTGYNNPEVVIEYLTEAYGDAELAEEKFHNEIRTKANSLADEASQETVPDRVVELNDIQQEISSELEGAQEELDQAGNNLTNALEDESVQGEDLREARLEYDYWQDQVAELQGDLQGIATEMEEVMKVREQEVMQEDLNEKITKEVQLPDNLKKELETINQDIEMLKEYSDYLLMNYERDTVDIPRYGTLDAEQISVQMHELQYRKGDLQSQVESKNEINTSNIGDRIAELDAEFDMLMEEGDLNDDAVQARLSELREESQSLTSQMTTEREANRQRTTEEVRDISKYEDVELIDYQKVPEESNTNYGYRAGAINVTESLYSQANSRGTGHFGTGVYFFGNKNSAGFEGYASEGRPVHRINLSEYNLFTPELESEAGDLHNFLGHINKYIADPEANSSRLQDIHRMSRLELGLLFEDITSDPETYIDSFLDNFLEVKEDATMAQWKNMESASTALMKSLGYEGIDVRHMNRYDTSEFGSVIYSLKENNLQEEGVTPTDQEVEQEELQGQEVVQDVNQGEEAEGLHRQSLEQAQEQMESEGVLEGRDRELYRRFLLEIDQNLVNEYENISDGRQHVYEIDNSQTYYDAIIEAKDNNPYQAYVDASNPEDLAGKRMFLYAGGTMGFAIESDGNITNVFKNTDLIQERGLGQEMMLQALDKGGNRLDHFDGKLTDLYGEVGFTPITKVEFNREFAPDGWNYERDGTPDIIFSIHNGDPVSTVNKVRLGEGYDYSVADLEYSESYDIAQQVQAQAFQEQMQQEVTKQQTPEEDNGQEAIKQEAKELAKDLPFNHNRLFAQAMEALGYDIPIPSTGEIRLEDGTLSALGQFITDNGLGVRTGLTYDDNATLSPTKYIQRKVLEALGTMDTSETNKVLDEVRDGSFDLTPELDWRNKSFWQQVGELEKVKQGATSKVIKEAKEAIQLKEKEKLGLDSTTPYMTNADFEKLNQDMQNDLNEETIRFLRNDNTPAKQGKGVINTTRIMQSPITRNLIKSVSDLNLGKNPKLTKSIPNSFYDEMTDSKFKDATAEQVKNELGLLQADVEFVMKALKKSPEVIFGVRKVVTAMASEAKSLSDRIIQNPNVTTDLDLIKLRAVVDHLGVWTNNLQNLADGSGRLLQTFSAKVDGKIIDIGSLTNEMLTNNSQLNDSIETVIEGLGGRKHLLKFAEKISKSDDIAKMAGVARDSAYTRILGLGKEYLVSNLLASPTTLLKNMFSQSLNIGLETMEHYVEGSLNLFRRQDVTQSATLEEANNNQQKSLIEANKRVVGSLTGVFRTLLDPIVTRNEISQIANGTDRLTVGEFLGMAVLRTTELEGVIEQTQLGRRLKADGLSHTKKWSSDYLFPDFKPDSKIANVALQVFDNIGATLRLSSFGMFEMSDRFFSYEGYFSEMAGQLHIAQAQGLLNKEDAKQVRDVAINLRKVKMMDKTLTETANNLSLDSGKSIAHHYNQLVSQVTNNKLNHASERIINLAKEIDTKAKEHSEDMTWKTKLREGSLLEGLEKAVNIRQEMRLFVPFMHTDLKMIEKAMDWTGINAKQFIQDTTGQNGSRNKTRAVSRLVTSWGIGIATMAMTLSGLVSGTARDPRERELMQTAGVLPNSIKINGKWHDMTGWGTVGKVMITGANLVREAQEALHSVKNEEEAGKVIQEFAGQIISANLQATFSGSHMLTMQRLLGAMQGEGADYLLTNFLRSFNPTYTRRNWIRAIDWGNVNPFYEDYYVNNDGYLRRDVFGNPIARYQFSKGGISALPTKEPIYQQMLDLDVYLSPLNDMFMEVEINAEQENVLRTYMGEELEVTKIFNEMVASSTYENANATIRRNMIKDLWRDIATGVYQSVLLRDEDFVEDFKELRERYRMELLHEGVKYRRNFFHTNPEDPKGLFDLGQQLIRELQ